MKHKISFGFSRDTLKVFKFESIDSWIDTEFSIERNKNVVNISFSLTHHPEGAFPNLKPNELFSLEDFVIVPFEKLKIYYDKKTEKDYHNNVYTTISLIIFASYLAGIEEELESFLNNSKIVYYAILGVKEHQIKIYINSKDTNHVTPHNCYNFAIFSTKIENNKLSVFK